MPISNSNADQLPPPDRDSQAHCERVRDHIRQVIDDAGGSIGFAEFMQQALYAKGLGYYSAGTTKFGEDGDFVTAPEISELFGKVLANQAAPVLGQIDDVGSRAILEIGAGTGALAIEVLQRLDALGSLPSSYQILEVSAELQQRQIAAIESSLPQHLDRVKWLGRLPESFSGVVLANEVVDAMPVERFVIRDGQVLRLSVTIGEQGFDWETEPAPEILTTAVKEIETERGLPLPDGYESEVSLGAGRWMQDLAGCVTQGFVFLFDYGVSQKEYYAADRSGGWLRCHFRHRAHGDPLIYPGIQDLTAWVNFTQLAHAAYDSGMQIAGYVNQAQFLLQGGLLKELDDISGLPTATQIALSRQVKLLTMPGEMGESFKCLGLSKGSIEAPALFALADRSHTL